MLKLFIQRELLGLRDAHTEDSNMGHPVSNETKMARGKQLAWPAGDIQ
jgi:hypothetical protein